MTQPRITPSEVEVAEAAKTLLPNGVALYTLASEEFEVLRISFVFRAGSALQQVPFSASAAANLLAEGTRDMTAREIAEQLDFRAVDRQPLFAFGGVGAQLLFGEHGAEQNLFRHGERPVEEFREGGEIDIVKRGTPMKMEYVQ